MVLLPACYPSTGKYHDSKPIADTTVHDPGRRVLNRDDLTTVIPDFIAIAEARFRRDHGLRSVQRTELSVTANEIALPSDFKSPKELYHDSATLGRPIEFTTTGKSRSDAGPGRPGCRCGRR